MPDKTVAVMKIRLTSVLVDDQSQAEKFYTEVRGFVKKQDLPVGKDPWLTAVFPEDPEGTELLLEPGRNPAAKPFKKALFVDGIPFTQSTVEDVPAEYERLRGIVVRFTQDPAKIGLATTAVLDDTWRNLIQASSPPDPDGLKTP